MHEEYFQRVLARRELKRKKDLIYSIFESALSLDQKIQEVVALAYSGLQKHDPELARELKRKFPEQLSAKKIALLERIEKLGFDWREEHEKLMLSLEGSERECLIGRSYREHPEYLAEELSAELVHDASPMMLHLLYTEDKEVRNPMPHYDYGEEKFQEQLVNRVINDTSCWSAFACEFPDQIIENLDKMIDDPETDQDALSEGLKSLGFLPERKAEEISTILQKAINDYRSKVVITGLRTLHAVHNESFAVSLLRSFDPKNNIDKYQDALSMAVRDLAKRLQREECQSVYRELKEKFNVERGIQQKFKEALAICWPDKYMQIALFPGDINSVVLLAEHNPDYYGELYDSALLRRLPWIKREGGISLPSFSTHDPTKAEEYYERGLSIWTESNRTSTLSIKAFETFAHINPALSLRIIRDGLRKSVTRPLRGLKTLTRILSTDEPIRDEQHTALSMFVHRRLPYLNEENESDIPPVDKLHLEILHFPTEGSVITRLLPIISLNTKPVLEEVVECAEIECDGKVVFRKVASGGLSNIYLVAPEGTEDEDLFTILKVPALNRESYEFQRDLIRKYGGGAALFEKLAQEEDLAYRKTANTSKDHSYSPLPRYWGQKTVLVSGVERKGLEYEYIRGKNFQDCFDKRTPEEKRVKHIANAAYAIRYLHDKGILHKDISGKNLMVGDDNERVYIIDLGLARLADTDTNTMARKICIAPEQLMGESSSILTDQYMFGWMLYRIIAQRIPYGEYDLEDRGAIVEFARTPYWKALEEGTTPELAAIIKRCMAFNPEDRYPSMRHVEEELRNLLDTYQDSD